ncbi:phenylacetate--CoA ligase family protein [Daejeonella oryzae]|uniref:hypothetical protein n=1 Tax=Daejeonella oryzae TaxID=1122943 RepID=UPI0003FE0747|nr:hypothetical protein [Daejeonella oryzae]
MNITSKLKSLAERIPPEAGILLNTIPFKYRLGTGYIENFELCKKLLVSTTEVKEEFIIKNFNQVFKHFKTTNNFYKNFLPGRSFESDTITSIDDLKKVPILNKNLLKESPIFDRTNKEFALKLYNTGGTSGSPLSFYLEKGVFSREWAHMHFMWGKIGYHPGKTKITIRGKNLSQLYKYNFNQNEFLINSYHAFNENDYKEVLKVFKKYNTEFIHGYPSSIYNFLKDASEKAPFLIDFLKKNIKGIMFGSEYPSPQYRNYIEDLLTTNTISWYGHTEAVILAGELNQKYEYTPLLSYGYAEAVKVDDMYHLVGTSFRNKATPFIRYDTEDLINPNFNNAGFMDSFEIKEGRLGEFVTDKENIRISLTGLIFGRHHPLFDVVDFIQVKQEKKGEMILFYSGSDTLLNPSDLFDSANVNIDISFVQIKEPFKTPLGKIPLLVK